MKKRIDGEMSEKQAERIIEIYDNASRNGEEWAHNVFLHRGTEKYEKSIETLNEAFRLKNIDKQIQQLPGVPETRMRKRTR
jgi:pyruvate-formate lyase-activating enzyme